MPLYEELVQKYKVHYVAGGAAQNAIRGAQVPIVALFSYNSTSSHPTQQSMWVA
jgi:hypothetical protein